MGKVIFEFDDTEEQESIRVHVNAWKVQSAIEEYNDYLRSRLKYEELTDEVYHALEAAKTKFNEILNQE